MAKLIYSGIMSLDGYTADREGSFDWSAPDDEVHAFVNEKESTIGTLLLGRRMYEESRYWETARDEPGQSAAGKDFADLWLSADKIIFSTTLETVTTARTRIEKSLDLDAVRRLKESSDRDLSISGPTLAREAILGGLVDEFQLYLNPVVVGGGLPYLPDGANLSLDLQEEHRFSNGVLFLSYRPTT